MVWACRQVGLEVDVSFRDLQDLNFWVVKVVGLVQAGDVFLVTRYILIIN